MLASNKYRSPCAGPLFILASVCIDLYGAVILFTTFEDSERYSWVKPVLRSRVVIELLFLFFVSFGDLKELGGFIYFNVNWSQTCNAEGFI